MSVTGVCVLRVALHMFGGRADDYLYDLEVSMTKALLPRCQIGVKWVRLRGDAMGIR